MASRVTTGRRSHGNGAISSTTANARLALPGWRAVHCARDIAAEREKVVIGLNGKRSAATLVYRSGALRVMVPMPAAHVGDRKPLRVHTQVTVVFRLS